MTFAIFGVAIPSDLIQNKLHTPFNIGRAIQLSGFTLEEAQPLARGLTVWESDTNRVLEKILIWTGGQPFLTQKLCQLVVQSGWQVDYLVYTRIIHNWQFQDEPEHLRTIRDRILHHEKWAGRLLSLYEQLLQGRAVPTNDNQEQVELLLSGLALKQ